MTEELAYVLYKQLNIYTYTLRVKGPCLEVHNILFD